MFLFKTIKTIKRSRLLAAVLFVMGLAAPLFTTKAVYAFSGSGTGASDDPYVVTSCYEFKQIDADASAYYRLANDIDCASEHNSMIAAVPFSGYFNGDGHSISIGLQEYPSNLGLFSTIDGGTVTNLVLTGTSNAGTGGTTGLAGSLAGTISNGAHITYITSSVEVTGLSSSLGGIAGSFTASTADNIVNTGNVTSNTGKVGGLFGAVYCGALVSNSHMSGDVSGNGDQAGGISGEDGCEGTGGTYTNVYSTGVVVSDGDCVGGIVGEGYTTILNAVYSTGYVEGITHVGGIAGQLHYGSSVYQSYATGDILGYGSRVGGAVGNLASDSSVSQSYAASNVTAADSFAGGLVGFLDGGSINNGYARGNVHSKSDGGLVGYAWSGNISHAYSTGVVDDVADGSGGLVGQVAIEGDNGLFWDTETSGTATSAYGHGKTTAEMKDITTYTSTATDGLGLSMWDFTGNVNDDSGTDEIWSLYATANDGYPCLNWQDSCHDVPSSPDSDGDGVSDAVEDAGPNNGDANNDGVLDKTQDNVVAILNQDNNTYGVLELSQSCEIQDAEFGMVSHLPTADPAYTYPPGIFTFVADCGGIGQTFTVKQYYYDVSMANFSMRKYNTATHVYSPVDNVTLAQQSIGNHTVLSAQYSVTDGGALDQDGVADGLIHDPAGIALAKASGNLAATGEVPSRYIAVATILTITSLATIAFQSARTKKSKRY